MEAREAAEKEWVEVVAMARVRAVVVMVVECLPAGPAPEIITCACKHM